MMQIEGKSVFSELSELVDPGHTALMVIDLQNDNVGPDGILAKAGVEISRFRSVLPTVELLIDAARKRSIPIFFTRNTLSRGNRGESGAQLRHLSRSRHMRGLGDYVQAGSWGNEVLAELDLREEDCQIVKYRSSAFHGTELDFLLRNMGIASVVVVGIVTEGCVSSTVRDLIGHGYYAVIASDAVASSTPELHEAALKILSARYDVVDSAQVLAEWAV